MRGTAHIVKTLSHKKKENGRKAPRKTNAGPQALTQTIPDVEFLTERRQGETARAEPSVLVDCVAVLGVVLSNLGTEIEKSNAAITLDELTAVTGDEAQLIQLFQNLVGNALKYRSERPPHVHVSAERIQELSGLIFNDIRMESAIHEVHATFGKGLLFSVTDNGIGIDPLYFDRIFQTSQRLPSDEKKYCGKGPGLDICKKIVERHGGRIWVASEPGLGSTFYFTIPARA